MRVQSQHHERIIYPSRAPAGCCSLSPCLCSTLPSRCLQIDTIITQQSPFVFSPGLPCQCEYSGPSRLSRIRIMAASNNSPRSACAATIPNSKKMPPAMEQVLSHSLEVIIAKLQTCMSSYEFLEHPETKQTVRKYSYNNLPRVTGGPWILCPLEC